jgi:hypothetical protein
MTAMSLATAIATAVAGLNSAIKSAVESLSAEVVIVVACGGLAAFGVRSWRRSNRTIGYRVEDARAGVHTGSIGGPV